MKLSDNLTQTIKLCILLISILLSGCASNSLYFGTSTDISLNVSGAGAVPSKISVGAKREEIAIVPNKKSGQAHSVYGSLDANLTWVNGQVIKQVFATGCAAINSTDMDMNDACADKKSNNNSMGRLYFGTRTIIGIDIGVGIGQTSGESSGMVLGYNRKEAAIIPVDLSSDDEANSVYADISIVHSQPKNRAAATEMGVDAKDIPGEAGGVRISTKFATGEAAIALTKMPMSPANQKLREAVLGYTQTQALLKAKQISMIEMRVQAMSKEEFNRFVAWCEKVVKECTIEKDEERTSSHFLRIILPKISDIGGVDAIQAIYTELFGTKS